jgi:hypothetical protein
LCAHAEGLLWIIQTHKYGRLYPWMCR